MTAKAGLLISSLCLMAAPATRLANTPFPGPTIGQWSYPTPAPLSKVVEEGSMATAPCVGSTATCIYLAAGVTGARSPASTASVRALDTSTNRWVTEPSLLGNGRQSAGGAAAPCPKPSTHECFYVVAGYQTVAGHLQPGEDMQMMDTTNGLWSVGQPMTTPRANFGATAGPCHGATKGTCVYALGGDVGGSDTASAEMFDPSQNAWTTITSMNESLSGKAVTVACGASAGKCVYMASSDGKSIEQYDPKSGVWTDIPGPPPTLNVGTEFDGFGAGKCPSGSDPCLYLMGGQNFDGIPETTVAAYDIPKGTWSAGPRLVRPNQNAGVADAPCVGDISATCLYATGPVTILDATVQMYRPGDTDWSYSQNMTVDEFGLAGVAGPCVAALSHTCVYTVGGRSQLLAPKGGPPKVESFLVWFDTTTGLWNGSKHIVDAFEPGAVAGPCHTDLNQTCVYVIGGNDGTQDLATVEMFDIQTATWSTAKSMPSPRSFSAVAEDGCPQAKGGTCIYVMGGDDGGDIQKTLFVYHVSTDSWSKFRALPQLDEGAGAAVASCAGIKGQSCIYLLGGLVDANETTNQVQMYEPKANKWFTASPMPNGGEGLGAKSAPCLGHPLRGCVYAAGGLSYTQGGAKSAITTGSEMFDPATGKWRTVSALEVKRDGLAIVKAPCFRATKVFCLYAVGGSSGGSGPFLSSMERLRVTQ